MTKRQTTKGRSTSAHLKAAAATKKALVAQSVDQDLDSDKLVTRGINKPLTEDDLDYALRRLEAGDMMVNIAAHLQVERGSIYNYAYRNPDFMTKLRLAQEIGHQIAWDRAKDIAAGGALSTGSIERDKLLIDVIHKGAKAYARRVFGDKLEVEQKTLHIHIDKSDTEW